MPESVAGRSVSKAARCSIAIVLCSLLVLPCNARAQTQPTDTIVNSDDALDELLDADDNEITVEELDGLLGPDDADITDSELDDLLSDGNDQNGPLVSTPESHIQSIGGGPADDEALDDPSDPNNFDVSDDALDELLDAGDSEITDEDLNGLLDAGNADITDSELDDLLGTGEAQTPSLAPASKQSQVDLEFWNAIKDTNDPALYRAYLEKFPDGTFAPIARSRLGGARAAPVEEQATPSLFALPAPTVSHWHRYQNARFGFSFEWPSGWFVPQAESTNGDGRVFLAARDGQGAKIVAYGSINLDNMRPKAFKDMVVRERARDRSVTYQRVGKTWFVLSGYQGNDIYYQKTIFDCGITATVILTYPRSDKRLYDGIVERVVGTLRPGRGIATSSCR